MPARKTTTTEAEEKVLVPTPADMWDGPGSELVELPSGNVAVCRKPNTFFLSNSGQVPESVKKASEAKAKAEEENSDVSPENIVAVDIIADFLVSKAFVKPRVSMLPHQKNAVYIGDLSSDDKGFILDHFNIDF